MKYVTVKEMIAIEKESDAAGHTYPEMMEHAGRGLAEILHEEFDEYDDNTALGLVGAGNNGGDTLVAFCYLQEWGWQTTAFIVRPRPASDPLLARAQAAGVEILDIESDVKFKQLETALAQHDVLFDGVLGTGIQLPLRGAIAKVLDYVQAELLAMDDPPMVVAVDCPSGVDCDSGQAASECIPADLTVTMAAVKRGLLKLPAYDLLGDLVGVSIGLPEGLKAQSAVRREVITAGWVSEQFPERPSDAHKGTFGTALVVAGSMEFSGALALAGEAAYRIGAGLVTLGASASLHSALAGRLPEATWLLLPHEKGAIAAAAADVVRENIERVTALLLGPGFGMAESTGEFLKRLFGNHINKKSGSLGFIKIPETEAQKEAFALPPLVIDADGLKLLAKLPDWAALLPKSAVLTPHPGEMAALTGLETAEIQTDRLGIAERFAAEWGHVVVLKGAFTVIAAPDGRTMIVPVASSALARAGSGDVLAGLITGLRAQGLEAFEAAAAGAWIHAQAGLMAAEMQGNTATVLAGDLLNALPGVLEQLL